MFDYTDPPLPILFENSGPCIFCYATTEPNNIFPYNRKLKKQNLHIYHTINVTHVIII